MKKEVKNLVKKKNFWITLVNNSIGIQIMICVTAALLFIVGNYILSRFEYEYLGVVCRYFGETCKNKYTDVRKHGC
ncbi:MAG: hypothetical protein ACLROW_00445 [Roseburia faecis]